MQSMTYLLVKVTLAANRNFRCQKRGLLENTCFLTYISLSAKKTFSVTSVKNNMFGDGCQK